MRPSGVWDSIILRKSLSANPTACKPSVSTMPGFSELTRIFFGPSSFESATVIASTAALVALYTAAVPTAFGTEQLDGFLRGKEQPQNVEIKLLVEVICGNSFKGRELVDPRVVDQDIELAIGGLG